MRRRAARALRLRDGLSVVAALVLAATTGGCRGMTSTKPPVHLNPSMDNQPKARAQSESDFFYDGASMRVPVPGTVARGELREDRAFFEGKDATGNDLARSPLEATPELVARGAERYRIYCQPCHDPRGDGKGVLAQRGGVPTTSMHDPKVLNATDGHLYNVITNGQGLMPAYRWPIPPADRWAIVAHVRHMQQQRQAEGAAQ
jgi:mono/diheme cytochrome c family protein